VKDHELLLVSDSSAISCQSTETIALHGELAYISAFTST